MTLKEKEFIPAVILTGFLEAGKTTFLNHMLARPEMEGARLCCIQFEEGEIEIETSLPMEQLHILQFSKAEVDRDCAEVAHRIYSHLAKNPADEVWVEWNGMAPLDTLQEMFIPDTKGGSCRPGEFAVIEKIVYLADVRGVETLLSQTGGVQLRQLVESDIAVLHGADRPAFTRLKRVLRDLNPGLKVLHDRPFLKALDAVYTRRVGALAPLLLAAIWLPLLYFGAQAALVTRGIPIDAVLTVFLGILLQGIPFLLIGVLLSSAIQVFVPAQFLERRFPKNLVGGMLFALFGGFCLPVCDCASVPVFRSLLRKGVPMPAAVTFMTAAPIINPVVILSTYYAFGGNWRIVAARAGLGILCAALVGLTFWNCAGKDALLSGAGGAISCGCGCLQAGRLTGRMNKLVQWLRHAQSEFLDVGRYLLIGALVSALAQAAGSRIDWSLGSSRSSALLVMMGLAFCLSLCSSSDAVVARSFAGQAPLGAVMGFLVFGPMMDVKNIIMLLGGVNKKTALRLLLSSILICFAVVLLFSMMGMEEWLL